MTDVAVLGAGRMGTALAARLATGGHTVAVWSRTSEHARAAADAAGVNATAVDDVSAAVGAAEVVLTFLADGAATCDVLLNAAVLGTLTPRHLVADLGTSGTEAVEAVGRVLKERGVRFVDAPVSGSVSTVNAGQLLIMASGSPADVAALESVLAPVASAVIRVGDIGAGQVMKLAVNLIVYATNAAISEALVLAESAAIPRETVYDVLQSSVVVSPFLKYKRTAFLDDQQPVAMALALVCKDLGLIRELAQRLDVSQPMTAAVADLVTDACAQGFGSLDMASLSRFLPLSTR
jgi:3-hydroxyisobutyrate dehydrogenase-like beta-hydroxyacid dehydrogenase